MLIECTERKKERLASDKGFLSSSFASLTNWQLKQELINRCTTVFILFNIFRISENRVFWIDCLSCLGASFILARKKFQPRLNSWTFLVSVHSNYVLHFRKFKFVKIKFLCLISLVLNNNKNLSVNVKTTKDEI